MERPGAALPRAPSHSAWRGVLGLPRNTESSLGWVGSWSRSLAGSPKPPSSHFMKLLPGCPSRLSVSQRCLETTPPGQPLRGQGASPSRLQHRPRPLARNRAVTCPHAVPIRAHSPHGPRSQDTGWASHCGSPGRPSCACSCHLCYHPRPEARWSSSGPCLEQVSRKEAVSSEPGPRALS